MYPTDKLKSREGLEYYVFMAGTLCVTAVMPDIMLVPNGSFYQHISTLISVRISNHVPSKVRDEIVYSFQNFNLTG